MSTIFDTPGYNRGLYSYPPQVQNPFVDYEAERRRSKRRDATVVWANTSKEWDREKLPETIFVDSMNIADNVPYWKDPALDLAEARKLDAKAEKDPSSTNIDRQIYGPWKNEFWYKEALNHYKIINDPDSDEVQPGVFVKKAAGGVIATTDSPAINVINVSQQIQGMTVDDYVLTQAVNTENTTNLTFSLDEWKGFTVYQDIGEGDPTFQQKGAFVRKTFGLKKDVGHIAITDEARLVPDRNVWDYHIRHVATEMVKLKNTKIAIELLTATTTTGGADWGAWSAGFSTNNPVEQIRKAAKEIQQNGGRASRIVSGSDPFTDFTQNTFVKGTHEPVPNLNYGTRVTNVAHLPGFTWYIDELSSQNKVFVFDPEAIRFLQGPTRTAMYRNEDRGIDGYITRDWNRVATIDPTIIRQLTSVTNTP